MSFESKTKGSYFPVSSGEIKAPPATVLGSQDGAFRIVSVPIPIPRMKDTKISVKFRITNYHTDDNWFGFLMRSVEENGGYEPVYFGSLLINSRVVGSTDITLFPGNVVLKSENTNQKHNKSDYRLLEVVLDDNYIKVSGDIKSFEFQPINLNNFGHLYLACYQCEVEYKDLEILNIDTITEST